MIYICELLDQSHHSLTIPGLNISKLEAIASVRFSLTEVAKIMYATYVEGKHICDEKDLQRLFECAKQVCDYGPEDHISKPR